MERCVCAVDSTTEVLFHQSYPDGGDAASLTLLHPFEVARSLLKQRGFDLECNVGMHHEGGVVYRHFAERNLTIFIIEASTDHAIDPRLYQAFLQMVYQALAMQTGQDTDFCADSAKGYSELKDKCAQAKGMVNELLRWLGEAARPELIGLTYRSAGFAKDVQASVDACVEQAVANCADSVAGCLLDGATVLGMSSAYANLCGHDFEMMHYALPVIAATMPRATVRDFKLCLRAGQVRAVCILLYAEVRLVLLSQLDDPPCDVIAARAVGACHATIRPWIASGVPAAPVRPPPGAATLGVFMLPAAARIALQKDNCGDLWWSRPVFTPQLDEPLHRRPPFVVYGDDTQPALAAVAHLLLSCIDALALPLPPSGGRHIAATSSTQLLDSGVAAAWRVVDTAPEHTCVAVILCDAHIPLREAGKVAVQAGELFTKQRKYFKQLLGL